MVRNHSLLSGSCVMENSPRGAVRKNKHILPTAKCSTNGIMQRIKYMPYILFLIGCLCGGGVLCPNRPEERELSE